MDVRLFAVPWDGGYYDTRMGAGPNRLVDLGAAETIRARGHRVTVEHISPGEIFHAEIRNAFALHRMLAKRVRHASSTGEIPIVLSGNCNSALGTLAGIGTTNVGMIWLDGHVDCETPETTRVGSLDGMGVSTAVGRCWSSMARGIPGFSPLPEERVFLVGSRNVDSWERSLLQDSAIAVVDGPEIGDRGVLRSIEPHLRSLESHVEAVYLHIDLDVLDADWASANEVAPGGGLTVEQVDELIHLVGQRFDVKAGALTSYDPAWDRDDRVARAALRFLTTMIDVMA